MNISACCSVVSSLTSVLTANPALRSWYQLYSPVSLEKLIFIEFAYCDPCYRSVVCLSVCHVRALCSNGRRYRHDFFCLYDSPISLPDRFKIWLPSVYPFLSKYYPKVTHPLQKGNVAVMLVMRFVVGSPLLSIFSAAFNGTEMVLYALVCLSETTRVLI